jgi:hypothetical protein
MDKVVEVLATPRPSAEADEELMARVACLRRPLAQ